MTSTAEFKILQHRMQECGWCTHHLHPAQIERVLVDGWVLVIDSRLHPVTQLWCCPKEDLKKHFH